MVTIYADTLVFINTFVTYFLLLACQTLCRGEKKRLRLLASSLIGGVYALTILLDPLPLPVAVLLRGSVCVLLRLIADGFGTARRFLKGLLVFLLLNFVFAGVMFLLQLLRPEKLLYSTGVVYLNVSVPFILLSTLGTFAVLQVCLRIFPSRCDDMPQGTLHIRMGDRRASCTIVPDTGHHLTDPFSGKPVLIVAGRVLDPLVPSPVRAFLHGTPLPQCELPPEFVGRVRLFPYSTVGAEGLLPAIRCSAITIDCGGRRYARDDVYLAAADRLLAGGEFDALMPQSVYDAMKGVKHHVVQTRRPQSKTADTSPSPVRAVDPLHRLGADAAAAARQKGGGRSPRASRRRG